MTKMEGVIIPQGCSTPQEGSPALASPLPRSLAPPLPLRYHGGTMTDLFYHERLYRGEEALRRLASLHLFLGGAGAVGSHLASNLLRQGVRDLQVIDFDRIEAHNVGTQLYAEADVGAHKVDILQAELFRATGIEIAVWRQRLTPRNVAKLIQNVDLVVDGFDNHAARALLTEHCRAHAIPCVHVGLHADYAEILWNEGYRVPQDPPPGPELCDYPLARNLVLFAVALASEAILRFVLTGEQRNLSFTLRDLTINDEG